MPMKKSVSKSVSFSTVMIRNFDLTIGVSPRATVGIPLSLDWTFVEDLPISLEDYELNRPPRRFNFLLTAAQRQHKLTHMFGIDVKTVHRRSSISSSVVGRRRRAAIGYYRSSSSGTSSSSSSASNNQGFPSSLTFLASSGGTRILPF